MLLFSLKKCILWDDEKLQYFLQFYPIGAKWVERSKFNWKKTYVVPTNLWLCLYVYLSVCLWGTLGPIISRLIEYNNLIYFLGGEDIYGKNQCLIFFSWQGASWAWVEGLMTHFLSKYQIWLPDLYLTAFFHCISVVVYN